MTISKDLLLAILSMDSYNRGYGAGISDAEPNDPDGLGEDKVIGNAVIVSRDSLGIDSNEYDAWKAAGFYAIAYKLASGETVISYRGTDNFNPTTSDSNVTYGWVVGDITISGSNAALYQ